MILQIVPAVEIRPLFRVSNVHHVVKRYNSSIKNQSNSMSTQVKSVSGSEEPVRHAILPRKFYTFIGFFWGSIGLFIAQHKYFTRPDENGVPRLHPITRMLLYQRESMDDYHEKMKNLMLEAKQEGEARVFFELESERPVKNPRFDARLLTQSEWARNPQAQDTNYVDLSDIKWRKGYGQDEDSVEVLQKKGLRDYHQPNIFHHKTPTLKYVAR